MSEARITDTQGARLVTQREVAWELCVHLSDVNVAMAGVRPAVDVHPKLYRVDEARAAMYAYYNRRKVRAEGEVEKWTERCERVDTWAR